MLLRNQIHKRIEKRSKRQLFNWLCLSVSLNVALGIILLNRGSNKLNLGPADEFRNSIPERWCLNEAQHEAELSCVLWIAYTDPGELIELWSEERAKIDSMFFGDSLAQLVRNSDYAKEFNANNMMFDRNRLQLEAYYLQNSREFKKLYFKYVNALRQLEIRKRLNQGY